MAKRKDDPRTRPVYRTERFVEEGGKWFYYTREGTLEGPFDGKIEAEIQLHKYIKVMNSGLLPEDDEGALLHRKAADQKP